MAWLATLDTKATRWPWPLRWSFLTLKWFLILVGAGLAIGLAIEEVRESRVGLGTGLFVATALATIKGILTALASPASPAPSRPPQVD